ncbi:MAG TPA: DUF6498-containing protein [Xanthomonadaceae bacterium]|nr:DUF6498-containing protein [Xanthomonadaceae bacterium]
MTITQNLNTEDTTLLWPDLLAFGIALACAWFLQWRTTELVWSLWLGSLVIGYLTILGIIASGVYLGLRVLRHPQFPQDKSKPAVVIGSVIALFLLGFFTFHFCAFHAGHAAFLSSFFPLEGLESRDFSDAFTNPFQLWHVAFTRIVPLFGLALVPVVIAERRALLSPWKGAHRIAESIRDTEALDAQSLIQSKVIGKSAGGKHKSPMGNPFMGPYVNVIRMHLLIFAFAALSVVGLENFGVFALVYAVYFFPWRAVFPSRKPAQPGTSP